MKKAFGEYQRIAVGGLGMSSLWMGGDHLLYIRGSGFILPFSEEYKRFRYTDIQGIALAKTAGLFWGALAYFIGFATAAGIAFALLFFREPGDVAMLAVTLAVPLPLAAVMLALLIRHLVLGPRCVCEIQTGVKRERLVPVNRLHQGRQILDQLSPRIREAQSGLAGQMDRATLPAAPLPPLRVPAMAAPTFAVLGVAGLLFLLLFALPLIPLAGAALVLLPAGAVMLLASLTGSVRVPCPDAVKNASWVCLASLLAFFAVAAVYFADQAINDPSVTVDMLGPLEAFAALADRGGLGFYLVILCGALSLSISALAGWVISLRWRARLKDSSVPIQQGAIADDTLSDRR